MQQNTQAWTSSVPLLPVPRQRTPFPVELEPAVTPTGWEPDSRTPSLLRVAQVLPTNISVAAHWAVAVKSPPVTTFLR